MSCSSNGRSSPREECLSPNEEPVVVRAVLLPVENIPDLDETRSDSGLSSPVQNVQTSAGKDGGESSSVLGLGLGLGFRVSP